MERQGKSLTAVFSPSCVNSLSAPLKIKLFEDYKVCVAVSLIVPSLIWYSLVLITFDLTCKSSLSRLSLFLWHLRRLSSEVMEDDTRQTNYTNRRFRRMKQAVIGLVHWLSLRYKKETKRKVFWQGLSKETIVSVGGKIWLLVFATSTDERRKSQRRIRRMRGSGRGAGRELMLYSAISKGQPKTVLLFLKDEWRTFII